MQWGLGTRARTTAVAASLFVTMGVASAPPALAFVECRDLGVSLPGATITAGSEEIVVPAMSNIGICYGAAVTWDDPPEVELREGCGTPCFVVDLTFDTADNFGVGVGYYYTDENGDMKGDHHGNPYFPITSPVPVCIAVGNPRPTC